MSGHNCFCGKPGDKKCSKCKFSCYCSRECQIADFPKHKKVCKHLTNVIEKATAKNTSANILHLPAMCARTPIPKLPPACPVLALEHLLPFFLTMSTTHLQCQMVDLFSPVISLHKNGNKVTVVALDVNAKPQSVLQKCTSFRSFYRGGGGAENVELAKKAFLALAFFGKCTTMCCCFGQLLLKAVQSHVMTYGGERVVAWAMQDGNIDLSHPAITQIQILSLQKEGDLAKVSDRITKDQPLPSCVEEIKLGRNSIHVWLTFVTESGRIFDLDLSALQFGTTHLPFPCVVPVTSATTQTTFAGMCTRHRILSTSLPELRDSVEELMCQHVTMCNTTQPNEEAHISLKDLAFMFEEMNQKVLSHAHMELPRYAEDPNRFWRVLRDLEGH